MKHAGYTSKIMMLTQWLLIWKMCMMWCED